MSHMQSHPIIDRAFEATAERLPQAVGRERAWRGESVDPSQCVIHLGAAEQAELRTMAEAMQANPLPILLRSEAQFEIPRLRAAMTQARDLLDNAQGVAVIDALPMDDLDEDTARAVYWVLGQCIARPVAQKWDGTMFYDVTDTGQSFSYGVRGSRTNIELNFHNDNAFAVAPPHYVGLMCFHPAREGGVSRFCSLYAVHEELRDKHPQLLERLYQPMLWDRQAEHVPGAPKILRAPMFSMNNGHLFTRVNVSLVRKGYQVAEETPDPELEDALATLEHVSTNSNLWFEVPIQRGHLQYLNNVQTAHYRSEFVDHEHPALKRWLVRTWLRNEGASSYDG